MSATLLKRRSGVAAQRAVGRAGVTSRVRKTVSGTPSRPPWCDPVAAADHRADRGRAIQAPYVWPRVARPRSAR